MLKNKLKKIVMVMLITMLTLSLTIPSMGTVKAANVTDKLSVPKVNITANSNVQLKEANMFPTVTGKVVSYQIEVYNGGSSYLNFDYYWIRVKSSSGER